MAKTTHKGIVDINNARRIVLDAAQHIEKEQTGIINAFGRTLAECVKTAVDIPDFDTAAKDGYAVISANTQQATSKNPQSLSVLSESSTHKKHLEPGTVMRVRKGDPLPIGADAVVEIKNTFRPGNGPEVLVLAEVSKYDNVQRAGSVAPVDELVFDKGIVITGYELGVLASLGMHGVTVRRKPRVAIITSGANVVEILEDMQPGEVRNSARYEIVGMLLECGCEIGRLLHIKDGRIGLEKAISGCANCDAFIVALGPDDKHDMAVQALENVGTVYFQRIQLEPGTSSAFGTLEGKPVFIAPGDAILEIFEAIIRPGLLKLLGRAQTERAVVKASLASRLKLNPGCSHYIKAVTTFKDDKYITKPLGDARCVKPNSLIVVPENEDTIKRGDNVDVMLLTVPY